MCEGCKWDEEKLKLTLLKKKIFWWRGPHGFKYLGFWKC
jgi:hypothetical protein